jgi:hypothetical protein
MNKMALQTIGYRKIIYLLVLLAAVIPMLRPVGMPVTVSVQTKDLYNYIENLSPDSNVAINFAGSAAMFPDSQAATRAVLKQLFAKPVNIVLWHSVVDGPLILGGELEHVNLENRVYGEDYVFLPYAGGGEATLAALAEDIRGVYVSDERGTALDDIPLMQNINAAEDFDLVLVLSDCGGAFENTLRQWTIAHGVPEGGTVCSIAYPDLIPFWKTGAIIGLTNGVRGGGEYELLIKSPGPGLKNTDVLSSVSLLYVVIIIIGNLQPLWKKQGGT